MEPELQILRPPVGGGTTIQLTDALELRKVATLDNGYLRSNAVNSNKGKGLHKSTMYYIQGSLEVEH